MGQAGGQRWRLKPLGVTQVGLLTGDMDMGSVRGTDRADENGTSEQESGGLADGAGVRRITDFRRGVGQVSTWS